MLNFLGSGAPALVRRGWKVRFSDRLEEMVDGFGHIVPLVDVKDVEGADDGSFEVGCAFDDGGRGVTPAEIQTALNRGESFIMRNGETLLLDDEPARYGQHAEAAMQMDFHLAVPEFPDRSAHEDGADHDVRRVQWSVPLSTRNTRKNTKNFMEVINYGS